MTNDAASISALAVGVDVVDLTADRTRGRSEDERFLERVFAESERVRINGALDPDRELWRLWACKEAAFKVVSKLVDPVPVFRYREMEVLPDPDRQGGVVTYMGHTVAIGMLDESGGHVLATATMGMGFDGMACHTVTTIPDVLWDLDMDQENWRESISDHMSEAELDAVHNLTSALVRLRARDFAATCLNVEESRLEIRCPHGDPGRRPPYLYMDGERLAGADVSLSHDGPFLACGILTRPAP